MLLGLIFLLLPAACGDPSGSARKAHNNGAENGSKESVESGQRGTAGSAEAAYEDLLAKFDASKISEPLPPEKSYEQRLARFGEDYGECGQRTETSTRTCEKPASLGERDLKRNINVQLILDASGSMQGEVGGERKIDVARRALTDFIGTLPEEANVSLRVYGHVGSSAKADRARSCAASELVVPFQKLDRVKLSEAINSFEPRGWTPVAGSLEKARDDFSAFDPETNSNFVYLVSDGVETCGGDPVAAAGSLAAADIRAEVNIVGFDVDPKAARQLEQAAKSGGGGYYDANNAAELNEVFQERFDWTAWTAYYNCLIGNAYSESNATVGDAYRNSNCITAKAYSEYNAMSGEAYRKYNEISGDEYDLYNAVSDEVYTDGKYEKYRDEILELAVKRRETRIEAAKEERDYTVEHAKEKREGLVNPAIEERKAIVEKAIQERDEAIKKAEEGREQNAGS